MKLILDDKRQFPDSNSYNCVRTYSDCILLMSIFKKLSFVSLDYDLGEDKTGYDVLIYMAENHIKVEHINIHSDHVIGVPKMEAYAHEHFPNTKVTTNSL